MPSTPLHILALGAHPDDPEAGCGGTLARYTEAGHRVTIVYLTRGERGIPGTTLEEAAAIRTAECEAACRILGARPLFVGQIDADTEHTPSSLEMLKRLVDAEKPDVLFSQWPVDTHVDHQVTGVLSTRVAMVLGIPLFFYEVNRGVQTQNFEPTILVDIASTLETKRAAIAAHTSQEGENRIYRVQTEPAQAARGVLLGTVAAEGFIPFRGTPTELPGL